MSFDSFLQDLELPVNAELDRVEAAFLEKLRERLRIVAQQYNETELQEEEEWLRSFLKQYFDFSLSWAATESSRYKNIKEFDSAPEIKQQAKGVVRELQDYISEFVSCYMHINRFMTLLRDEIREEEIKVARTSGQKIKWSADSGYVIARYRKDRQRLLARIDRILKARPTLESLESDFAVMRKSVLNFFGKEKGEAKLRGFNSGIRTSNFSKARRALEGFKKAKKKFSMDQKTAQQTMQTMHASGSKILETIEKEQKMLISEENRLFLKPVEIDFAYNADIRELHKIKEFLEKYHLPYMEYKLGQLDHLKDKLLVLNTLESLMTLYKRLIMGIALPLKDIKTVRLYESDVLNHTKYLLTGHFTELPKILQRANETVHEFRESRQELDEFKSFDLKELEIDETKMVQL